MGRGKEEESSSCMNNEDMGGGKGEGSSLGTEPPKRTLSAMFVPLTDGVSPSSHLLLG